MRVGDNPLVWAAISVVLVLSWQSFTVHANYEGNWTGLFQTGQAQPVPEKLVASTFRDSHPSGYDGQFYRFLAHDPWLQHGVVGYFDNPSIRSRRILVPLLAWVLAGGRHGAIDGAYILLISASIFVGVYWLGRIMVHHGRSSAWGLSFLAVPAVPIGIDSMTVDVSLAALTAYFAWQVQTDNRRWLWLTVAAAPLIRETGIILVGACVIAPLLRRKIRTTAYWMTAAVPALLWSAYLYSAIPARAATYSAMVPWWVSPKPKLGILSALFQTVDYPNLSGQVESVVHVLDTLSRAGVIVAVLLAALQLLRIKWGEMWIALAATAAFVPFLSLPSLWLSAYSYSRPISPLFVLMLAACGARLSGPTFTVAMVACLMIDLRISAEVLTQVLGILSWMTN